MSRTFDDLIPDLLGARGLTGVPPEIAVFHLRKAAIELCEQSFIWKQTVTIDAQAGVRDYPIELKDEAYLVSVDQVKVGHCCLTPDRSGLCTGCGCHQFSLTDNTLWVPEQLDDVEQHITLTVICKPKQDSCVLPEQLYQDWSEVIADGAAQRCFSMPKTDWYNAGLVTFYTRKFSIGLARAKNQRSLGRVTGPLMMRGGYF